MAKTKVQKMKLPQNYKFTSHEKGNSCLTKLIDGLTTKKSEGTITRLHTWQQDGRYNRFPPLKFSGSKPNVRLPRYRTYQISMKNKQTLTNKFTPLKQYVSSSGLEGFKADKQQHLEGKVEVHSSNTNVDFGETLIFF